MKKKLRVRFRPVITFARKVFIKNKSLNAFERHLIRNGYNQTPITESINMFENKGGVVVFSARYRSGYIDIKDNPKFLEYESKFMSRHLASSYYETETFMDQISLHIGSCVSIRYFAFSENNNDVYGIVNKMKKLDDKHIAYF